ncbi:MAG TPA: DUF362 domain-containing protein [Chloroflexota bacterium]|nr:DUF362 domain-containing protein [Chloroflexota bacterium]
MSRTIDRRRFLRNLLLLGAGYGILPNVACSPSGQAGPTPAVRLVPTAGPTSTALSSPASVPTAAAVATTGHTVASTVAAGTSQLVVARGSSPEAITRSAIETLGGMSRFVKPGAEVIVKPNICAANWSFEYAVTTNPEVVGTIVKLCVEAGAKRVRVMDFPFSGTAEQAYSTSGIGDAVRAAGGQMEVMSSLRFGDVAIPNGRDLKTWKIYRDAVDPNVVLINVPIAKQSSVVGVTMGMKNLMGLIQDRPSLHTNIDQRLADLNTAIRPALTVVDAVRILLHDGPTGGSLDVVKKLDTVVASGDPVAADSYGATLFGRKGSDLAYIRNGAAMGLGVMDLSQVAIKEVTA